MPDQTNHTLNTIPGRVIIAGAGCGDPELITVKAARYLQQAEVVLADRLVSHELLLQYVRADAVTIYVGKQCGRGFSTPQESINHMMKEYALQGRLVVRLKGGDVSLFSNILDELRILAEHRIPYEIIPGITAATGAAAYAGIPLTARGYSTAVRLVTLHKPGQLSADEWKSLAATDDTLVLYMSSGTLDEIVDQLTANHISPAKGMAIIEQATTPMQHVHISSFEAYRSGHKGQTFISPSLVIIGKVVELHQQFAWLPDSSSRDAYFKPMGNIIPSTHTDNAKTNVSRA